MIGDKPMTNSEKQARFRLKFKQKFRCMMCDELHRSIDGIRFCVSDDLDVTLCVRCEAFGLRYKRMFHPYIIGGSK